MDMKEILVEKVTLNIGAGEGGQKLENAKILLERISGRKAIKTLSQTRNPVFHIKKGDPIGVKVTLRGDRMWEFLDKLISIVLPRTKDFRGTKLSGFDNAGNYSLGIKEHTVFPEIDPNKVQKIRPLEVTIVTTARNKEDAKLLLTKFGFPLEKDVNRS